MIRVISLINLYRSFKQSSYKAIPELAIINEVVPRIKHDRLGKASTLLLGCGQTGVAILQLANQTEVFTRQAGMLARAFMETVTNFCYVGVCDDKKYRAFYFTRFISIITTSVP